MQTLGKLMKRLGRLYEYKQRVKFKNTLSKVRRLTDWEEEKLNF